MFYSNDRNVISKLIAKLFSKLEKIDTATKLLKKSIKKYVSDFFFESTHKMFESCTNFITFRLLRMNQMILQTAMILIQT